MYNDWQDSYQISHRRLRYKNLDGQNKKANSTLFQKKQDKTVAFPLCLYSISNTKGIKNSKWYSFGINKHFNFVEYIDKILKIENALT